MFFASILTLLFDHKLADEIVKNAKSKVKAEYNWAKITSDTHFVYQKAIAETVAERQAKQIAQEDALKKKKASTQKTNPISNLLDFNEKKQALA